MQLPSNPHRIRISQIHQFLLCLVILGAIFQIVLQPSRVYASTKLVSQGSIKVVKVDASELSTSNSYVSVWVENTEAFPSEPLILDISYLSFPSMPQGKSWKSLNQLNYSSDTIELEKIHLPSLASGEARQIDLFIKPNDVAKLKKNPTIFVAKLYLQNAAQLLSYQTGFAYPNNISMIHTAALAFDNPNYESGNLVPQIQGTIKGISSGLEINSEVFSIVLADDFGEDDTRIYFVYNGFILPANSIFVGLPDVNGDLSSELLEYDMGDGEVLGGYLQWVRQISYDQKLTFSFYGHGGALMPDISPQPSNQLGVSNAHGSGPITMPSWVILQPSWVILQPSWVILQPSSFSAEESFATDAHPVSLISVKDLAVALKKGSNDGANPIDVVDLVHCFSLSIEEVYELAPYAKTIIGSANYHFFDSRMAGQAVANLDAGASAENIATSIMATYDHILPGEGYPRTMAVINSAAVADIKRYWDQTSAALLSAFDQDHQATRAKLQQAYLASTKYDSTSCDNEFDLGPPDALVDFYEFSSQIGHVFSDNLDVAHPAQLTSAQIDAAVIAVINRSGLPWFGTNTEDIWQFNGKGLSIYADLMGLSDKAGRYALSWQSAFYNRVPHELSPSPFDFVSSDNQQPTWSDVIQKSWEGFEVAAQGCVISIPLDPDEVEVALSNVHFNETESGNKISADFHLDHQLGNLNILFEVTRAGEVIYSEYVHSGWLDAGHHTISTKSIADGSLFELQTGDEQISVTLDPDGYISEENKDDNNLTVLLH